MRRLVFPAKFVTLERKNSERQPFTHPFTLAFVKTYDFSTPLNLCSEINPIHSSFLPVLHILCKAYSTLDIY